MKTFCFGLNYLGGRVDLRRLHQHLAVHYPEATLEMKRAEKVLSLTMARGTLTLEGKALPFELTSHHFASGHGIYIVAVESQDPVGCILDETSSVYSQPAVSQALADFLKRCFGVEDFASLDTTLKHKEGVRDIKAETGIEVAWIGQEDVNIGFEFSETLLVVGPSLEAMDMQGAKEISKKEGEVLALSPDRLWARAMDDDLLWDLVLIFLREHGVRRIKAIALHWLVELQRQLSQMQVSLGEGNKAVLTQDREEVEDLDLRFHVFTIEARRFLVRNEFPWLEAIDRDKWGTLTLFRQQKELVHETLEEGTRALERMTRPLDFREFKLLKSGVEEVEARIMLLTVLLVLMEFFTQALVPGHWIAKGILLILILAIPTGYFFFGRWRKQEALRKGRAIFLGNRLERVDAEIRLREQELERLKSADFLNVETKEGYRREMNEIIARYKDRRREYEDELEGFR